MQHFFLKYKQQSDTNNGRELQHRVLAVSLSVVQVLLTISGLNKTRKMSKKNQQENRNVPFRIERIP